MARREYPHIRVTLVLAEHTTVIRPGIHNAVRQPKATNRISLDFDNE